MLYPQGLEIITIALDAKPEVARAIVERHPPEHPSLIDSAHTLDALFGVVNVPSGIWIDEDGMIVRPPEPAMPKLSALRDAKLPDNLPPHIAAMMAEARKIRSEPEKYVAALRDWAARGAESKYALSPDDVIARSRPRPIEESQAAAHFALAQHLVATDRAEDSVRHFREAHRLQPVNWTYRRQAWSLVDPVQGPTEQYAGDWLSDVLKIGAENYYPPLEL